MDFRYSVKFDKSYSNVAFMESVTGMHSKLSVWWHQICRHRLSVENLWNFMWRTDKELEMNKWYCVKGRFFNEFSITLDFTSWLKSQDSCKWRKMEHLKHRQDALTPPWMVTVKSHWFFGMKWLSQRLKQSRSFLFFLSFSLSFFLNLVSSVKIHR